MFKDVAIAVSHLSIDIFQITTKSLYSNTIDMNSHTANFVEDVAFCWYARCETIQCRGITAKSARPMEDEQKITCYYHADLFSL